MSTETVRALGVDSEYNWQRFGSKQADELLRQLARTSDPTAERRIAIELQKIFVTYAPAFRCSQDLRGANTSSTRITGFPTKENHPYAPLAPYRAPGYLLTLLELQPVAAAGSN
jgi:ABC-type transport system substrate-binding protein